MEAADAEAIEAALTRNRAAAQRRQKARCARRLYLLSHVHSGAHPPATCSPIAVTLLQARTKTLLRAISAELAGSGSPPAAAVASSSSSAAAATAATDKTHSECADNPRQ